MTIRALGIEHELHVVDLLQGEHKKPDYLKINPRGKVPAIVDGDLSLGESRALMCYLCNEYANGFKKDLYPSAPAARAKVDQMLYVGEAFEAVIMQQYPATPLVIFGGQPLDESKRPLLDKALDELEGYLTESTFVAGDNLTIADFIIYTYVTNLDIMHTPFDYSAWPLVSKWRDAIQNLPYHDVCNKSGMEMLGGLFRNAVEKHIPKLEFYGFFLSPFSRVAHMTLIALGIPFEMKTINLLKGEHKTEEYLKINPKGQVPAIKLGDVCLAESRAIAAFLCNKYADDNHKHLYPEDPKLRANIDMFGFIGSDAFDAFSQWLEINAFMFGDGMPTDDHFCYLLI